MQACVAAFVSYFLVRLVPYWGLAVIGTTVAFFVPLIYISNQELIDRHLDNISEAIGAQTAQVRSILQKQADQLAATGKQYAGDYTGKVQEMLRGRGASPPASGPVSTPAPTPAQTPVTVVTKEPIIVTEEHEFPAPPTEEPQKSTQPMSEPLGEVPEAPVLDEAEPLVAL